MSNAAITYFAIDLKHMPAGDVRILELVELDNGDRQYYAGLSGMSSSMFQARDWVKNTVYAHTSDSLGVPVYDLHSFGYPARHSVEDNLGLLQIDMNRDFDPADIGTYACVLNHAYALNHKQRDYLESGLEGRVLVTNQNVLCQESYVNKACFYALAQDAIPDLLPKQGLYAVVDGRVDIAQILDDFKGSSHVVLKQPENYKGMGVDVRPLGSLKSRLDWRGSDGFKKPRLKFSITDESLLVVQEVVKGAPVPAKNQNGEEGLYDPAIRVIATAWHSEGQTHIKCHGAYYKFPEKTIGDNNSRTSLVSNIDGKGPRGGVIPDETKSHIYQEIESRLPPLFDKLLTRDPAEMALELLRNPDPQMQAVGVHLAERIHRDHYGQSCPVTLDEMCAAIQTAIPDKTKRYSARTLANISETYRSDAIYAVLDYMISENMAEYDRSKSIFGRIKNIPLNIAECARDAFFLCQNAYKQHPVYAGFVIGAFTNAAASLAALYTFETYSKWDMGNRLKDRGEISQTQPDADTSYQEISVYDDNFSIRSAQLKSAAANQGFSLCTAIEPLSAEQSRKLLADFHQASPQTRVIGVRLNDSFHVFASECPEQDNGLLYTPFESTQP